MSIRHAQEQLAIEAGETLDIDRDASGLDASRLVRVPFVGWGCRSRPSGCTVSSVEIAPNRVYRAVYRES